MRTVNTAIASLAALAYATQANAITTNPAPTPKVSYDTAYDISGFDCYDAKGERIPVKFKDADGKTFLGEAWQYPVDPSAPTENCHILLLKKWKPLHKPAR